MKQLLLLALLSLLSFVFFSPLLAQPAKGLTMDEVFNQFIPAMDPSEDLNQVQFINEVFESNTAAAINATGGNPNNPQAGLIPNLGRHLAHVMTTPPIQTSTYIADVMQNFGFAEPAYAQGFGFSALTPVLAVWKAFRNIAYFLLVVVLIIVGFMIMFRAQINPQTVVTVQQALPKIVITLILITFSYAIAGFIIDLIYLLIFVVTEIFEVFGILQGGGAETARQTIFSRNVLSIGLSMIIGPSQIAGDAADRVSDLITNALGIPILSWLVDAIAYLIIAIAMIVALFRTLFTLIMTYINLILSTVFAPIQLLLNAIPGQNTFSGWLKNLAANAAVFPATAIMLIIGAALVGGTNPENNLGISPNFGYGNQTGWTPPFVADRHQTQQPETIGGVIGLGIIMLLPEVAKLVKGLFGVEESQIGQMVQANLGRGVGPGTAPFRTVGTGAKFLGTNYAGYKISRWADEKVTSDSPSSKATQALANSWRFFTRGRER